MGLKPYTLIPKPWTLNPPPYKLKTKRISYTQNPKPLTLNPNFAVQRPLSHALPLTPLSISWQYNGVAKATGPVQTMEPSTRSWQYNGLD